MSSSEKYRGSDSCSAGSRKSSKAPSRQSSKVLTTLGPKHNNEAEKKVIAEQEEQIEQLQLDVTKHLQHSMQLQLEKHQMEEEKEAQALIFH